MTPDLLQARKAELEGRVAQLSAALVQYQNAVLLAKGALLEVEEWLARATVADKGAMAEGATAPLTDPEDAA